MAESAWKAPEIPVQEREVGIGESGRNDIHEKRETFETRHGRFVSAISATLAVDRDLLVSLIGRESRFDPKARHEGGSTGLTQLTGSVFEDLVCGGNGRGRMFSPYLAKIAAHLDANSPKPLRELCLMASAGEIRDVRKWNANVNALSKLRKDPNVSLAIGGIFFTALRDRIDETTKEPKPSEKQRLSQLLGRLEHPKNVAKIYRGIRDLGHVGADSSPEMIVESIKKLRSGIEPANAPGEIPERLVHFLALRKYNRNMVPESGGLRHQDIYAAIVLLSGEREKNREASKDRQTKAKAE